MRLSPAAMDPFVLTVGYVPVVAQGFSTIEHEFSSRQDPQEIDVPDIVRRLLLDRGSVEAAIHRLSAQGLVESVGATNYRVTDRGRAEFRAFSARLHFEERQRVVARVHRAA